MNEEEAMGAVPEPKELTQAEFKMVMETRIKDSLQMTVPEFIAALKHGSLDPEDPQVAGLAILVGARTR